MNVVLYTWIVRDVLSTIISIIGVVGNVLSAVVLTRPEMRSSVNCLLLALAASDTVFIVLDIIWDLYNILCKNTNRICFQDDFNFFHLYLGPIKFIAQTISIYLTLFVSVERWLAVCYPFRAMKLCTIRNARWCVLGTVTFSVLYNASRFLHYYLEPFMNNDGERIYVLKENINLFTKNYVVIYVLSMHMVMMFIVPLSALMVLNACIVRQVWRAQAERARFSAAQQQELNITKMLLVLVLVFIICNLPLLVSTSALIVAKYYATEKIVKISLWYWIIIFTPIIDLLLVTYSSVNFIIYGLMGKKFKTVFLKVFCVGWLRRWQNSNGACSLLPITKKTLEIVPHSSEQRRDVNNTLTQMTSL